MADGLSIKVPMQNEIVGSIKTVRDINERKECTIIDGEQYNLLNANISDLRLESGGLEKP